jgi:hypothetical protein
MANLMTASAARPDALSRRERFRRYMKAFNPTAPARGVIKDGLVLEDLHRSLYQTLAARADLEPGSQQLVIGGIGSGKTTELLLAENWLSSQGLSIPRYIDITAETDLSSLTSGSLLAALGLDLIRLINIIDKGDVRSASIDTKLQTAKNGLRDFALGKTTRTWVEEEYGYEPDEGGYDDEPVPPAGYYRTETIPGKLAPPVPRLSKDVQGIREPLEVALQHVTARGGQKRDLVVLFDGLDRLITPEKFWSVAFQDLKILKQLKVSVLATAPLAVLYEGREIAEYFDRVHHLAALPTEGPQQAQLESVLLRRGGELLLSKQQMTDLSMGSGGVLRDLITLARDSAEEAYIAGGDNVSDTEIESAILQLGTSYLRGLTARQRNRLRAIQKTKEYDFSEDNDMELLATRRVLEYSVTEFGVHPALRRVLEKLANDDE